MGKELWNQPAPALPGPRPLKWGRPEPCLTLEEMKEDILRYIEHYDWVTIAEMIRRYEDQAEGENQWEAESDKNIVFYTGLSEKLINALRELLREKKAHLHPASWLAYMLDGGALTLPLAQKPPRGGYRKPHWMPVCFRPGPNCMLKDCPARLGHAGPRKTGLKGEH
jgi:hypothetical protein